MMKNIFAPQFLVHYGFHFVVPGIFAWIFFPEHWELAWLLMIGTMAVDIDHVLAKPIFDAKRCSIGFHVLHSYPMIILYGLLLLIPHFYVQVIAAGLLLHMYTDWQDCMWTAYAQRTSDTGEQKPEVQGSLKGE